MARYTATDARRHFFQLLDAAERGEKVVLERHGVSFNITLEAPKVVETPSPIFVVDDPEVLQGDWTWVSDKEGQLQFQARDEA